MVTSSQRRKVADSAANGGRKWRWRLVQSWEDPGLCRGGRRWRRTALDQGVKGSRYASNAARSRRFLWFGVGARYWKKYCQEKTITPTINHEMSLTRIFRRSLEVDVLARPGLLQVGRVFCRVCCGADASAALGRGRGRVATAALRHGGGQQDCAQLLSSRERNVACFRFPPPFRTVFWRPKSGEGRRGKERGSLAPFSRIALPLPHWSRPLDRLRPFSDAPLRRGRKVKSPFNKLLRQVKAWEEISLLSKKKFCLR